MLKMLQNIFVCVEKREVFWLVNRKVLIELCSAISLIDFWNVCNLFGSMRMMMGRASVYDKLIAEKCVEDASEHIWLRWEARSVLISTSQSQIELCSAITLIVFWNVCDLFGSMRSMMGRAWVYDKLIAEKCVEDAWKYIWLRL